MRVYRAIYWAFTSLFSNYRTPLKKEEMSDSVQCKPIGSYYRVNQSAVSTQTLKTLATKCKSCCFNHRHLYMSMVLMATIVASIPTTHCPRAHHCFRGSSRESCSCFQMCWSRTQIVIDWSPVSPAASPTLAR